MKSALPLLESMPTFLTGIKLSFLLLRIDRGFATVRAFPARFLHGLKNDLGPVRVHGWLP